MTLGFRARVVRPLALAVAVTAVAALGAGVPQQQAAQAASAKPAATGAKAQGTTTRDLQPLSQALRNRSSQPVRLVFLGSSTTSGVGATAPAKRYVDQVVSRLSLWKPTVGAPGVTVPLGAAPTAAKGIEGFNGGVGGTWVGNYLSDAALQSLAATAPACVFHMIGSNDAVLGVAPATYGSYLRANLARIDRAVATPVCHVLVHTYRRAGVSKERWAQFRDALERVADQHPRAISVDASKTFERLGVPGSDPVDLISTDNVHPSDRGHARLARTVTNQLMLKLPLLG